MCFIMVDIGTVESVSVMFELDLLGSFYLVGPHERENNSSSESPKKKKTWEARRVSLLLRIDYADL